MKDNRSYFVGVLLTASRNPLNRIQFAAVEDRLGSWKLYSRIKDFNRRFDVSKMDFVGEFPSLQKVCAKINSTKCHMKEAGISVPGVELFTLQEG